MKAFFKSFVRFVLIVVFVPIALLACNVGYIEFRMYRLQHADHARILSACRQAIENRASYHSDNDRRRTLLHQEGVLLSQPLPASLPGAIRQLHPHDVTIHSDYTLITFSVPFYRMALLGFRSGAEQFGTFKYFDGLWFWNGNDSKKMRPTP